jgi:hypothetical protein
MVKTVKKTENNRKPVRNVNLTEETAKNGKNREKSRADRPSVKNKISKKRGILGVGTKITHSP